MNDWDLSNIRADIMLATDIEHLQAIDNYYENIINNLQSKIDKAIDKLKKYGLVDKNGNFNAYLDTIELKELYDDLKDDKIQEIPQFKGTMEQLDDLCDIKKENK